MIDPIQPNQQNPDNQNPAGSDWSPPQGGTVTQPGPGQSGELSSTPPLNPPNSPPTPASFELPPQTPPSPGSVETPPPPTGPSFPSVPPPPTQPTPPPYLPTPQPKKSWLWVLLIVLLLLIGGGLAWSFLMPGGFFYPAEKLLLRSNQQFNALNNYSFSASILAKPTGNGAGANPTSQSSQNSSGLTAQLQGAFQKPDKVSAEMNVKGSLSKLSGLLFLPSSESVALQGIKFIVIGQKVYYQLPKEFFGDLNELSSQQQAIVRAITEKWVERELTTTNASKANQFLTDLPKMIKSIQRLSNETVDNVPVYHLKIVLDKDQLLNELQKLGAITAEEKNLVQFGQGFQIDCFIGKKDFLPYKLKVSGAKFSALEGGSQVTTEFNLEMQFDYKKPVKVEAPPADQVVKASEIESALSSDEARAMMKVRDAKRKQDLSQIKVALEMYKNDHDSYPVASQIDKTNNKNGVLAQSLAPYIKKLPVDPKDPEYWYGYLSDGKSYTLWCLLEDTSDTQGTRDGQWYKYIVTND